MRILSSENYKNRYIEKAALSDPIIANFPGSPVLGIGVMEALAGRGGLLTGATDRMDNFFRGKATNRLYLNVGEITALPDHGLTLKQLPGLEDRNCPANYQGQALTLGDCMNRVAKGIMQMFKVSSEPLFYFIIQAGTIHGHRYTTVSMLGKPIRMKRIFA